MNTLKISEADYRETIRILKDRLEMNEWKTEDRVQFVVDKWSDRDKAALLAALLENAGAVKIEAFAIKNVDGDPVALGGECWLLPIPEDATRGTFAEMYDGPVPEETEE